MESVYNFVGQLDVFYDDFKEKSLVNRRFKHDDLLPLINKLKEKQIFNISITGNSAEGRELYLIKTGLGKQKIFLWSQMHGDEPTATAALFDMLNFLAQGEKCSNEINAILKELEIFFLPMVNPDGTQLFKRRNSLDIDLNRDAERLQADETNILKRVRDQINPHYAFNLHDQDKYYTVGSSRFPASISFLAPSFNVAKEIDEKRSRSMHQINIMNRVLQKYIPGQVGRYSDDFMPNAFGDKMQLWGSSTILIESGGNYNDPERQIVRKMNFLSILASLFAIANKITFGKDIKAYFNIPENKKERLFDLLIRNANIIRKGKAYKIDVGIRNKEVNSTDFRSFHNEAQIAEIGDLTYYYGYNEMDANGLYIKNLNGESFANFLIEMPANFCLTDEENVLIHKIQNGQIL
jgi:hypothetical protein